MSTRASRSPEAVVSRRQRAAVVSKRAKMGEASHFSAEAVKLRELSGKARKALPTTAFAIPEKRAYPIHDRSHAANALARASGKPEEGRVKAAVHKRYPNMGK